MTWTYTNNPSNSNRDLIRTLVNDIDTDSQLLTDEFIAYALAAKPSVFLAAEVCAIALSVSNTAATAYLASNVTKKKVGDLELTYGGGGSGTSAREHYLAMGKQFRLQAGSKVTPFSGGISVDDKNTQQSDSDWDRPFAEIGMHDDQETSQQYDAADTGWR